MMLVLLLIVMKSKGKERVRVFVVKRRRRRKRSVWREMKLEASLYTQKGRDISEIPKIPLA